MLLSSHQFYHHCAWKLCQGKVSLAQDEPLIVDLALLALEFDLTTDLRLHFYPLHAPVQVKMSSVVPFLQMKPSMM